MNDIKWYFLVLKGSIKASTSTGLKTGM